MSETVTPEMPLYQPMPPLSTEEYDALKSDIAERGVVIPVEIDEEGNILDGHHRIKAWRELRESGIMLPDLPRLVREGMSEQEKHEYSLAVNVKRRQVTNEWKKEKAIELRQQGWQQQPIADTLGVSQGSISLWLKDVINTNNVSLPKTITDTKGRKQPTKKTKAPKKTVYQGGADEPVQTTNYAAQQVAAFGDERLNEAFANHEISKDVAFLLGSIKQKGFIETYEALWEHEHQDAQVRRSEAQLKHLLFLAGKGNGDGILADLVTLTESGQVTSVQTAHKVRQQERKDAERAAAEEAAKAKAKGEVVCKVGQVWQLGRHTLYCGDTSSDEFKSLLEPVKFAFADPPYNANVAEWDSGFVWAHDYLQDFAEVVTVTPGISAIFDFARLTEMPYRWSVACWITNGMTRGALGFGNWIYAAVFSSSESVHHNTQDFTKATIDNSETGTTHKGRKPTAFITWLLQTFTAEGDAVIDPFLGSGTTLLVSESLGRVCTGGEINLDFCAHIISRWESLTGQEARLINA